jgi:hypothetical protein
VLVEHEVCADVIRKNALNQAVQAPERRHKKRTLQWCYGQKDQVLSQS